ncbi:MAG: HD domain-containing protein [Candidatus Gracilibacteria bacterium]|nr:HD domain-containing protein [Candidatus Gracilibacteria bacterium]MDD2908277.1 HD domain-containing protein [Candidatus Gracilibacteria bacterium]
MVFITKYRQKSKLKKHEFHQNILAIIGNILKDEEFIALKKHRHHLFFNRYEHLINTSRISYTLAKIFKADITSCTLAGILHDFHSTRIKGHMHGIIAANNSKKFEVNEKVLQIIRCHMYPFGRSKVERFKGVDFWIVKSADFFAMCYEISYSVLFLSFRGKNKVKLKKNNQLLKKQQENDVLSFK